MDLFEELMKMGGERRELRRIEIKPEWATLLGAAREAERRAQQCHSMAQQYMQAFWGRITTDTKCFHPMGLDVEKNEVVVMEGEYFGEEDLPELP